MDAKAKAAAAHAEEIKRAVNTERKRAEEQVAEVVASYGGKIRTIEAEFARSTSRVEDAEKTAMAKTVHNFIYQVVRLQRAWRRYGTIVTAQLGCWLRQFELLLRKYRERKRQLMAVLWEELPAIADGAASMPP